MTIEHLRLDTFLDQIESLRLDIIELYGETHDEIADLKDRLAEAEEEISALNDELSEADKEINRLEYEVEGIEN